MCGTSDHPALAVSAWLVCVFLLESVAVPGGLVPWLLRRRKLAIVDAPVTRDVRALVLWWVVVSRMVLQPKTVCNASSLLFTYHSRILKE